MAKDIHNAAGYGNPKEVSRFLKQGVPVDSVDHEGATPLARAARFNHVDVAQLLVAEGAAIDHQDEIGRTPLHRAAAQGCLEMLNFLLSCGANIEATDARGETPLMYAAAQGQFVTTEALIANRADINAQDEEGYTALVHSMLISGGPYEQRLALMRALLDSGADVGIVDAEEKTTVEIAQEIDQDPEAIAILQAAAGIPVTAEKWDMVGGDDCVLCKRLKRWKPSKTHPDYIRPDVLEDWLGASLPGRIKYASDTMYRGKRLVKFSVVEEWHSDLCDRARNGRADRA